MTDTVSKKRGKQNLYGNLKEDIVTGCIQKEMRKELNVFFPLQKKKAHNQKTVIQEMQTNHIVQKIVGKWQKSSLGNNYKD